MKRATVLLAGLLALLPVTPRTGPAQVAAPAAPPQVEAPAAVLEGNPFEIRVALPAEAVAQPYTVRDASGREVASGTLAPGETAIEGVTVRSRAELPLVLAAGGAEVPVAPRVLPGWVSLVPPMLAIGFALVFREVVISLFGGIWLGALLLAGFDPIRATMASVDRFALGALAEDSDRVAIVMFSLLLGGMVGVMTRSGGTLGIVEVLRPLATSSRRGQIMTWLSGLIIFFDDYANTLIVGNTMRPVTDRLRVSREKLAYIVDSTAAPMAAIAAISTWVGFEISLIGSSLESAAAQAADPAVQANLQAGAANPFNVFLHSIPYLFYPILALVFVLMIVVTGRDFGPMLVAERRAARGGGLLRPGAKPAADPSATVPAPPEGKAHRWYNAILPVVTVIVVALLGIYYTGTSDLGPGPHPIWDIMGAGDPFRSLLWASFSGCLVAIALAAAQRILSPGEAIEAWLGGLRAMLLAIVILVLAWGLGGVTEALGTGGYLAALLGDALPLAALPVLVFLVAAATSFATGTSWGTMAILFPVVIPLAVAMGAGVGFDGGEHYTILLGAISSIMAGSIFGDHCSPISDTTVLSSMASACDHIDHVRTQLPYALTVGVVAMLVGDIPTAMGMHPAFSLVAGVLILFGVVWVFGKPSRPEGEARVEATPELAAAREAR
jgi:Na+/H+ antiporter NhaC